MDEKYIAALLSQMAYSTDLEPGMTGANLKARLLTRLGADGVTEAQADFFASKFSVVFQQPDTPTGFSATVFRANTGEYYFAMKGSDPITHTEPDWTQANLDNALNGLSRKQIVDMVNLYLQLTHAGLVQQYALDLEFELPSRPYYKVILLDGTIAYNVLKEAGTVTGLGLLTEATPLTVAGHSLGGNLASAFALLFAPVVTQTITFNSAGLSFTPLSESEEMLQLIADSVAEFDIDPQTSAENVIDVTAPLDLVSDLRSNDDLGEAVEVLVESVGDSQSSNIAANHAIDRLSDALAVCNLLTTLDSTLSVEAVNQLLSASSGAMESTLEKLVIHVMRLFGRDGISMTDSNDSVYTAIYQAGSGLLATLTPNDYRIELAGQDLVDCALAGDKAALYALIKLQPFVVRATTQAAIDSLYAPHNSAGELNVANYTEKYLVDRALMLNTLVQSNMADAPVLSAGGESFVFSDPEAGLVAIQGSELDPFTFSYIKFGGSAEETLTGASDDDRLYGMNGNDVLKGNGGADYLEGGRGNDHYIVEDAGDVVVERGNAGTDLVETYVNFSLSSNVENLTLLGTGNLVGRGNALDNVLRGSTGANVLLGDAGFDTYHVGQNDVIGDRDGNGKVYLDGALLTGGARTETGALGEHYEGGGKVYFYDRTAGTLYVADEWIDVHGVRTIDRESSLKIRAFVNGDLGIVLEALIENGSPDDDEIATQAPGDAVLYGYAGDDNLAAHWPGHSHQLFGGSGNDVISTSLFADYSYLYGGDGDDWIETLYGTGLMVGGEGADKYHAHTWWGDGVPVSRTIVSFDQSAEPRDTLILSVFPDDPVFARDGFDLLVTYSGIPYTVRIVNQFYVDPANVAWGVRDTFLRNINVNGDRGEFKLSDFIPAADYENSVTGTGGSDNLTGTDLSEEFSAGAGDDEILGGKGDDLLKGGAGADRYRYRFGDGHDELVADRDDTLTITGVNPNDVSLTRRGNDLILGLPTRETIKVQNYFASSGGTRPNALQSVAFSGEGGAFASSTWDQAYVDSHATTVLGPRTMTTTRDQVEVREGATAQIAVADLLTNDSGNDLGVTFVGNATFGSVTYNAGTGQISFTPEQGFVGRASFDYIVSDRVSVRREKVIVEVLPENVVPEASGETFIIPADDVAQPYVITFDELLGNDSDADLDALSIVEVFDPRNGTMVVDYQARTVTFTLDAEAEGQAGFDYRISDGNYSRIATVTVIGLTIINGTPGNDELIGTERDDRIIGNAGQDSMWGMEGNDTFVITGADAAFDRVNGGGGEDTVLGGSGDDTFRFNDFSEPNSVEVIDGGPGINVISGSSNSDQFDLSNTALIGIARIEGLAGSDFIMGSQQDDVIYGNEGEDTLSGMGGDDTFVITGTDTDVDIVDGGMGEDTVLGGAGDDTFRFHNYGSFSYWVEFIDGGAGHNVIAGNAGGNLIDLSNSLMINIDRIEGLGGNDRITGTQQGNVIHGNAGDDSLTGVAGNNVLVGGDGSDNLWAGTGNDTLDPGADDDNITGGTGNSTIYFAPGYGDDYLDNWAESNEDFDVVDVRIGYDVDDVFVRRYDEMLEIVVPGTDDRLTVNSHYSSDQFYRIDGIHFADGTFWDKAAIDARLLRGSDFDDYLQSYGPGGVLDGGAGDDELRGYGAGNNTYRFGPGYDSDVIRNPSGTGFDVLEFKTGIAPGDVELLKDNRDLHLSFASGDDELVLDDYFRNGDYEVEEIRFGNGTVWTPEDITRLLNSGTDGDDIHVGTDDSEIWYGVGGNDQIKGKDGDDTLFGGAGNDTIDGGRGNDSLDGGDGNDEVISGIGDDTLSGAAGNDKLYAVLEYGPPLGQGELPTPATKILEGGSGNDLLYNSAIIEGVNELQSLQQEDPQGEYSSMVYRGANLTVFRFGYGDGQDQIVNLNPEYKEKGMISFRVGVTLQDLVFERADEDLVIQLDDSDDQILVKDYFLIIDNDEHHVVSAIELADGTVLDEEGIDAAVMAENQANVIDGTNSSNTLTGTEAVDVINGLGGNDVISGLGGNDTIVGGAGRDVMSGGGGDDTFVVSGTDAEYDAVNGGDGLDQLLGSSGDDTFRFHNFSGDNTVERIDGGSGMNLIAGTDGANVIDLSGTVLVNITRLEGLEGSDNLTGSSANDTIVGGLGRDVMNGGAGDDIFLLNGSDAEYDAVNGGEGIDELRGGDADDTFRFHNFSGVNTVERIDGGAGLNVIVGTIGANVIDLSGTTLVGIARIEGLDGSDNLTGSAANDLIIGGVGRDVMRGEGGDDTFMIDGNDAEYDAVNGGDGVDKLLGGEGNDVFRFHNFSGDNTVERIDGGAGINLIAGTDGANVIDLSGTVLANITRIEGLEGSDNLTGSSANDTIVGGLGRDVINGGAGDDVFLLNGSDAEYDAVNGGEGADELRGGDADDTFRFHNFSGVNTVERIDGGAGLNVIAGTLGANVIDLSGTTLVGIVRIEGLDGADNLTGSAGNDVMIGGAGRDVLKGEGGNDTFLLEGTDSEYDAVNGGDGLDQLLGSSGDDTFRFHNFSGDNTVERIDGGSGMNLIAGTDGANVIDLSGTTLVGIARIEGLDGSDNLTGSAANDLIIGGVGRDVMRGEGGDDTFMIDGNDAEYDAVNGGDGVDKLLGGEGNDVFRFHNFSGDNTVERIDGGAGINLIAGTDGANAIDLSGTVLVNIARVEGLAGNDNIKGSAGNDAISGGTGQDALAGGTGDDAYYYGLGDGNDTIDNRTAGATDVDTLHLDANAIGFDDMFFSASSGDLFVKFLDSNETIRIKGALQDVQHCLDAIYLGNEALLAEDVDDLVAALTGFTPGGNGEFSAAQRIEIAGVVAGYFDPLP